MSDIESGKTWGVPQEMRAPYFAELFEGKEAARRMIPVSKILTSHLIVDQRALTERRQQITTGTTLTPLIVRERRIEQAPIYDVLQGSHTAVALTEEQIPEGDAYIFTQEQIPDEHLNLIQLRATVEGTRTLQFARFATILREAFEETSFAQRGITVAQTFAWVRSQIGLLNARKYSGVKDLTEDELAAIKSWATIHAEACKKNVPDIYKFGCMFFPDS